ncbi:hypothetical protein [Labilibaculum antarcticum]|uniref:DUF3828 domain-containing protein n=1 Tax=Labilibaculum antarcticum TaxID=1717717 RepID=A0A1Y1CNF6_9BACT|nr:hypothetical protein [Labilibaculum antarcticum]BAX81820.1 hypothetical protein ALGA_3522 [Labilibaculum antarcticum]
MKKISKLFISFLILFSCLKVYGQEAKSDTVLVTKTITEFYEWYIHSTRSEENEENRPVFVIDSNDIVRLDLTRYLTNLRIYHFSEQLISREIANYKNCEENLKKITKEEFLSFDDIFAYEDIDCGFDNSYKWIGGQEMIDGIRINKLDFSNKKNCHVEIEYYSINGDEKSFWRNSTVIILRKRKSNWEILDIKI